MALADASTMLKSKLKIPKLSRLQRTNSTPKPSGWRRALQLLLALAVVLSLYVLYLQRVPAIKPLPENKQKEFISSVVEIPKVNRIIIPKIAVSSEIFSGNSSVLNKGSWHRYPDRGDPEQGGNFIIAAHRYVVQWTPQRTVKQSVLYNINVVTLGDKIFIDWNGKRIEYVVTETKTVKPNDSTIELSTSTPQLTLYTCTLKGVNDGREVVIAKKIN
ncbi:MAG: sortase [bacterium]